MVEKHPSQFSTLLQARRLFSFRDERKEFTQNPQARQQLSEDERDAFRIALTRRDPEQLVNFRREYAPTKDGKAAFIAAATGLCQHVVARIDEKIQVCGENGNTTLDFLTPEGDFEMIVACGEQHIRKIATHIALTYADRDESLINDNISLPSPILGRNGFRGQEYQRRSEAPVKV